MRKHPTIYKVVAEPTLFMDVKFRRTIRYFCSKYRAWRWSRRYLRQWPCGECHILKKKRRGT